MAVQMSARGIGSPADRNADCRIEVVVLYTTIPGTLESLKRAASLADGLAASIRLLVLTVVPYPLALESPQVSTPFAHRRFTTIASEARVDTVVDIRLGRDWLDMVKAALNPGSLVVMERQRGWWPRSSGRLSKRLARLGHQVVLSN